MTFLPLLFHNVSGSQSNVRKSAASHSIVLVENAVKFVVYTTYTCKNEFLTFYVFGASIHFAFSLCTYIPKYFKCASL